MKKLFIAAALLTGLATIAQGKESLKITWPAEYKFKEGSNQDAPQVHIVELVPAKESIDNWTLLAETMLIKKIKVPGNADVTALFEQQSKQSSPDAKLTLLESDDKGPHFWAIFKIETPKFPDDPKPESQLYYTIQGELGLYVNFVAVKEKELTKVFIEKWTKVFKASRLVNE